MNRVGFTPFTASALANSIGKSLSNWRELIDWMKTGSEEHTVSVSVCMCVSVCEFVNWVKEEAWISLLPYEFTVLGEDKVAVCL